MTNQEWLASLKAGDEVAYNSSCFGTHWVVTKIAKITPTGQIKTESGLLFKKGASRVNRWVWCWLKPVTDSIRESARKAEIMRHLRTVNFDALPIADLEEIYRIVTAKAEGEKSL